MENKLPTLAIVIPGLLPVPATNGGAVESLCENFIKENERQKLLKITVFSNYDINAEKESKLYKYTKIEFIKIPSIIKHLDLLIYSVLKSLFPKKNTAPFRYILQRVYYMRRVSKLISILRYDRLLFENQILLLSTLKRHNNLSRYKNKYLLHTHNQITRTYGNKKLVLEGHNITVSNFITNNLKQALGDSGQISSYSTVRNGIDQQAFSKKSSLVEKNKLRQRFGVSDNEKVLLFVGRLTAEKGIDKLILSLKHIRYENYKLLVVGSSFFGADVQNPFVAKLNKLTYSVRDRIIFTGHVTYSDMPSIYSIADIAVLPSVGVDAAPLTIVESLTAGLPIITTDSGGIPEYVNSECARILKRDENLVFNIAKNVDDILSDKKVNNSMVKASLLASRKLTLNNYYKDMVTELRLEEIYDER